MRKLSPLFFIILLGAILTWLVLRPDGATPDPLSGAPDATTADGADGAGGANGVEPVDPLDPLAAPVRPVAERGAERVPANTPSNLPGTLDPAKVIGADPTHLVVVDDRSGRLVPGAEILVGPPRDGRPVRLSMPRAGIADAAGRFDPRYWQTIAAALAREGHHDHLLVLASVAGYGTSEWVRLPDLGTAGCELRVVAGGELSGIVRDHAGGTPIAGAAVHVQIDELGKGWQAFGAPVHTDDAGVYRVAGLPPARILRTLVQPSKTAEPLQVSIRQEEAPAAALAAGRAVRLALAGERARLDLEGFSLHSVRATFQLRFPEGATVPAAVTVTHGYTFRRPRGDDPGRGSITGNGGTQRLSVRYVGDTIITSRESDANVELPPGDPQFTLTLPRGLNHLSVYTDAFTSELWTFEVSATTPPLEVVRDMRAKGEVVIQLVDGEGASLRREGVTVEVAHYRRSGTGEESGRGLGAVITDADGRAGIGALLRPVAPDAGDHADRVALQPVGKGIYDSDEWGSTRAARMLTGTELIALQRSAQPGAPAIVTVPAVPSRPLEFRVVDVRGRALAGIEVTGAPATRFRSATSQSDAEGLVRFDYLGAPWEEGPDEANPRPITNHLGVTVGADHWDDPVFTVAQGALSGRLELEKVTGREPRSPEERAAMRASGQANLDSLRRAAEIPGPGQAEAKRTHDASRLALDGELDTHARLVATGMRELHLTCVDGAGAPWAGLTVALGTDSMHELDERADAPSTASDGTVRVKIPLDARTIWVSGEIEGDDLFPAALALHDGTHRYRVVLRRQKQLQLEVRWPAGVDGAAQLAQSSWFIRHAADRSAIGTTWAPPPDGEGRTTIDLPMLPIILEVQTRDGVFRGEAMVDVPAGGLVVLDMQRAAKTVAVRIHVVDRAGQPLTGVVQAYAVSPADITFTWHGTLDAEGAFAFPLVEGTYSLMVLQSGTDVGQLPSITAPSPAPITVQLGKR